ncbi:DUF2071 domain-containing protein [Flavihumibacter sp. UBA7668]|uniref:DUF2071 domain-containing protein n=1 Tax=Flavihumibacter sp. UBA7668 TaxID=1946542 RepID=UPI0025BBAADC|nr:DUF2071 domain-containing protein [Flavihumibacter sp. UBA7668]
MFNYLKSHPFAVEAFFESSVVLTYALPKLELNHLIPPCLELDLHENQWGFIAVAMVQTKRLRPKGFPAFLGNDFFLIGYRVFVRYTTSTGKKMRGLFILRSETNKKWMELLGSIFTHYNYRTASIIMDEKRETTTISAASSGLLVEFCRDQPDVALPTNSPFSNWKEARRFAGPLPYTFSYLKEEGKVLIIEGIRSNWIPVPLKILHTKVDFLEELNLNGAVLANAFEIRDIPYYWKKGRKDTWK